MATVDPLILTPFWPFPGDAPKTKTPAQLRAKCALSIEGRGEIGAFPVWGLCNFEIWLLTIVVNFGHFEGGARPDDGREPKRRPRGAQNRVFTQTSKCKLGRGPFEMHDFFNLTPFP